MVTLFSLEPKAAGIAVGLAFAAPIVLALMVHFLVRVVFACKR